MSSSNVRPLRSRLPQESIPEFSVFANDLNNALQKCVPTDLDRYKHAAVMSITWNNDDIGVMPQTDQFLHTVRRLYNYDTEKFVLDATRSVHQVTRDLTDAILAFTKKHEATPPNNDHLLVYFYSGHSDSGANHDQLRLAGRLQSNGRLGSPWLDWNPFGQLALQYPQAETIMILDSCNAAMASIQAHGEILAASGWETWTTFTKFLNDEFTDANGRAFTASQLHASMMGNAIVKNIGATPIHRANPDGKPSVLFHKILGREAGNLQLMPQETAGKVVIKVSVVDRGNIPTARQWENWLSTNMPPDLQDIEILDMYESTSVSVLIAVPVVLWNYLEDRQGYQYIDRYWGPFSPNVSQGQSGSSQQAAMTMRAGNIPRQIGDKAASPTPGSSKGEENIC